MHEQSSVPLQLPSPQKVGGQTPQSSEQERQPSAAPQTPLPQGPSQVATPSAPMTGLPQSAGQVVQVDDPSLAANLPSTHLKHSTAPSASL